ncbi:MAG: hypothetical protein B7733_00035 [Myxococcales bacterium FL481]|nr:MAG: hypothetical protein B7733_00035 [Myxococcales bacterium FL481]
MREQSMWDLARADKSRLPAALAAVVALHAAACLSPDESDATDREASTEPTPEQRRYPPLASAHELAPDRWPGEIVSPRGDYHLTLIPGGTFEMGSSDLEPGHSPAEAPVHQITLEPFYLGTHEVTNAEYKRYLEATGATAPDGWVTAKVLPDEPVVGIMWMEARQYAEWAGLTLPTEAQWEYAARAGSTTRYAHGDTPTDLQRAGWCGEDKTHRARAHHVAQKAPNRWGLFDMHGNVWEWVADPWGSYRREPAERDGLRRSGRAALRAIRGGSWHNRIRLCRSASRSAMDRTATANNLGFRAARSTPPGGQAPPPFVAAGFIREPSPFPGYLYRPNDDQKTHPAVVLLHGSSGGTGRFWHEPHHESSVLGQQSNIPATARMFTEMGFVTLALCYFDCSHIAGYAAYPPDELTRVDIHAIVESAIAWLRSTPFVDDEKVGLWGNSRGGELALLLASLASGAGRPDAVIALSPAGVVVGNFTRASANDIIAGKEIHASSDAAWTYGAMIPPQGRPIAIEEYRGPLLSIAFLSDPAWGSLNGVRASAERVLRSGRPVIDAVVTSTEELQHAVSRIQTSNIAANFLHFNYEGHSYPDREARPDQHRMERELVAWFLHRHLND